MVFRTNAQQSSHSGFASHPRIEPSVVGNKSLRRLKLQNSLSFGIEEAVAEMPAKIMSSLSDENQDLRKQIGCMNIFQLLHRRHFLAGRSMSSHHLLPGAQQQLELHNVRISVTEKDLQAQKMKPRVSSETSQASTSSSSTSTTFSSLDCNIQINTTAKSQFQITAMKEQKYSSTEGLQSPDIRDVVKDSMYREVRRVPIKTSANDERKMKHADAPGPLQQTKFGKPKTSVFEGTKNSKDERLALPRFSYDGRESQDTSKMNMKIKDLPRFSLDSKASSIKCSAPDSRLNYLGHDENENSHQVSPGNQELGGHSRSNSIVAKLMGLDAFPDSTTTDESLITKTKSSPSPSPRVSFLSESSTKAEGRKQKQHSSSPPVKQKNPSTTSPQVHNANSVRNTCLRFPIEQAPWKQQESRKMVTQIGRAQTNSPRPSSSVYGEIEKRIAELEFKRSGKDLRALKQILEAMQKTRERLENQKGESSEPKMQERRNLGMETPHLQKLQTQDPKENSAQKEKARYDTPRNDNMKEANQCLPSIEKKITSRNLEVEQNLKASGRIPVKNSTSPTRGFGMVSTRVQYIVVKTERQSLPKRSTSESDRVKNQTVKKVRENCPQKIKHRVKSTNSQLSDDQMSNLSNETRCSSCHGDTASTKSESNNSIASHIETDVISSANFISTNSREQQDYVTMLKEQMAAVKLAAAMMEQPSPISVLDTPFYGEGSPSPVKKISTDFQDDESPSPNEVEWHLKNLNQLTDSTKSNSGCNYNQKSENQLHFIHEPMLWKTKTKETATDHIRTAYQSINPGQTYLTKILQTSGLLKPTNIIQTANQPLPSCHLINSDTIHATEEMEDLMEEAIAELIEKNDQMKLNNKIQGKFASDVINEIMTRKMTSDGLYNLGRKRSGRQQLIKEVYLEMDHLCRLPYCYQEDDDGSIRILTADMKYQSDDWMDYSGAVPALVLDIERLIFKDLINEVVTCEAVGLHDRPKRHCRQLFTK